MCGMKLWKSTLCVDSKVIAPTDGDFFLLSQFFIMGCQWLFDGGAVITPLQE